VNVAKVRSRDGRPPLEPDPTAASVRTVEDRIAKLAPPPIQAAAPEAPASAPSPETAAEDAGEYQARDSNPTGPTDPTYPIVGPRLSLASGSGASWSWGVWSRERTDLVGNVPVTTTDYGADSSGERLPQSQVADIAAGAALYSLSGVGSAGAVVFNDTQANVLQGPLQMNLSMGAGPSSWNTRANLAGGGDSLDFQASGSVVGGALSGSLDSYSLNAFGTGYGAGSLSAQRIDQNLVGDPAASVPVKGATVDFEFQHGGGPTVRGAGGVDF
jgi:hypothetical protein